MNITIKWTSAPRNLPGIGHVKKGDEITAANDRLIGFVNTKRATLVAKADGKPTKRGGE